MIQCGGDIEEALAACEMVLEGEMKVAGQEHFYLETQVWQLRLSGTIYEIFRRQLRRHWKVEGS